ncbi:MAG: hypothetical protein KDK70_14260 [Myxococcales bacterium]|nr:hypothetical protein [Myxococcales bacterium]
MRSIKTILTTLSIGLVASAGGCDPSEDAPSAELSRATRMDAVELQRLADPDDATAEPRLESLDEAILAHLDGSEGGVTIDEKYLGLMDRAIEAGLALEDGSPLATLPTSVDASLAIEDVDHEPRSWWNCIYKCYEQWEICIGAGRPELVCDILYEVCQDPCWN